MENQLIVYSPKKKIKKTGFKILIGVLISLFIFIISAFSSASILSRLKWDKTEYVNLKSTQTGVTP